MDIENFNNENTTHLMVHLMQALPQIPKILAKEKAESYPEVSTEILSELLLEIANIGAISALMEYSARNSTEVLDLLERQKKPGTVIDDSIYEAYDIIEQLIEQLVQDINEGVCREVIIEESKNENIEPPNIDLDIFHDN